MSLFVYVLADIIHLVKIIVLCDMFFLLHRRDIKHKGALFAILGIVMSGVSVFIYKYDNDFIEFCIYVVALILMILLVYKEKLLHYSQESGHVF